LVEFKKLASSIWWQFSIENIESNLDGPNCGVMLLGEKKKKKLFKINKKNNNL